MCVCVCVCVCAHGLCVCHIHNLLPLSWVLWMELLHKLISSMPLIHSVTHPVTQIFAAPWTRTVDESTTQTCKIWIYTNTQPHNQSLIHSCTATHLSSGSSLDVSGMVGIRTYFHSVTCFLPHHSLTCPVSAVWVLWEEQLHRLVWRGLGWNSQGQKGAGQLLQGRGEVQQCWKRWHLHRGMASWR